MAVQASIDSMNVADGYTAVADDTRMFEAKYDGVLVKILKRWTSVGF